MTRSPTFDNGMGLDIHTRTEMVAESWSLISNAAIRLGKDIYEITNQGVTYVNGVEHAEYPILLAGKYPVTKEIEMVEGTTNNEWNEEFQSINQQEQRLHYTIDLSARTDKTEQTEASINQIKINIYRNMISVRVDAYMEDAEGMLGVHDTKGLVGRDHATVYEEANDMGAAWQVREGTDASLFVNLGSVVYPEKCIVPSYAALTETHRRLRSYVDTQKMTEAKAACANVPSDMYNFCIEDVLRTGDVSMVHGFAF
jgi:hypothetical protein